MADLGAGWRGFTITPRCASRLTDCCSPSGGQFPLRPWLRRAVPGICRSRRLSTQRRKREDSRSVVPSRHRGFASSESDTEIRTYSPTD